MKRYRVLRFDFDTRANILKQEIMDGWDPKAKEHWKQNQRQVKEGLIAQYGSLAAFQKIENFINLGALPISIIAFHNKFLRQIRDAFIIGSYYPALTGACALGERILNQLIIHLRNDYKNTEQFKKIHRKESFDNWDMAIDTLERWGVLLPDVVSIFRKLKQIRHKAIHFKPETDVNDRDLAFGAINKLQKIIEGQFSGFGIQPWFIPDIPGAAFIKKEHQETPFVKRIMLPSCALVGPYHLIETGAAGWIVKDEYKYKDKEISDEEFAKLLNNRGKASASNNVLADDS